MTGLLASVVAQVTDFSCYQDGGMYQCMVSDIHSAFGGAELMGLIAGGAVMLSFYIASDFDPAPPTVGTIIFGGLLIPALPTAYTGAGTTMMLLGIIIAVFVVVQRYVLQVGS